MSFKTLKVEQLRFVAEAFTLDVDEKANKAVLLAAIEADEFIEWDDAVAALKTEGLWEEKNEEAVVADKKEKAEVKAARPKDTVLKMLRANRSYEKMGYRFTVTNPFCLVTAEDAEAITDSEPEGFRYASPKEVTEFYG